MKFLVLSFLLSSLYGCGGGSTTGNPVTSTVNVQMEDQQPFAWIKRISDEIIPPAYAAVSSVKFCFKRLRFKPDSSTSGEQFELALGEVDIDPSGTNLLSVSVPRGSYGRIEFDLEGDCNGAAKPSVVFTNGSGTYSTQDNMTINFEGVYIVSANGTLKLNIDALFDAMDVINNDNQIKESLEAALGDY